MHEANTAADWGNLPDSTPTLKKAPIFCPMRVTIFLQNPTIKRPVGARSSNSSKHFNPKLFEPATFVDRGVNLPFTSPLLFGARARPQEEGSGLEVIIANLSGGDGVYIFPWNAIPQICTPTLHLRRFWQLLRDETSLTPRSVKDAAESAAIEGLAGRGAAAAVHEARLVREARRKQINFALLIDLIKRSEGPNSQCPPPESDDPGRLMVCSQRAVARSATQLCTTTEAVAVALEELSQALNGLGLLQDNAAAPAHHRLAELGKTTLAVASW
ncbi:MAG: hypothetical protein FJX33_13515 [Alphaproteobacteria bacterium]|nr:hypothetical protein [Alphaproteobacteria bacterium]